MLQRKLFFLNFSIHPKHPITTHFFIKKKRLFSVANVLVSTLLDTSTRENWVVRQILLVRNHRQDFLYAKKRNPGYD